MGSRTRNRGRRAPAGPAPEPAASPRRPNGSMAHLPDWRPARAHPARPHRQPPAAASAWGRARPTSPHPRTGRTASLLAGLALLAFGAELRPVFQPLQYLALEAALERPVELAA